MNHATYSLPAPPSWSAALTTVGVTGTNGKSTTTTWVARALDAHAAPAVRATTLGYALGDTELEEERSWEGFLRAMRAGVDAGGRYAAIELTSEALARGFVRAWPCRVGVFTNLSHDHLDAHGSAEHYLASKAQLFLSLPPGGTAVLNAADEVYPLLREIVPSHARVLTYGSAARGKLHDAPNLEATGATVSRDGTFITLAARGLDDATLRALPHTLHVAAPGSVYAENAMAALLGAIAAGVPADVAARALAACAAPKGRFEIIHTRPCVIIDYAHSPDAIERTVEAARAIAGIHRLLTVFGAGGHRDRDKRGPMGAAAAPSDRIVLTTDNARDEDPAAICAQIQAGLRDHRGVSVELDRARAIALAIDEANDDDVVLVCGKGHETTQSVGERTRDFSDHEVARAHLRLRASK